MKQANGTGSVYKLKGNRRKPFTAVVTTGVELLDDKARIKRKTLGYYATQKEARQALAEYNAMTHNISDYEYTFDNIWQKVNESKLDVSYSRTYQLKSAYEYLKPLHNKVFNTLKTSDFQALFDSCDKGWGTQAPMKYIVNACYKYAIENDICSKNYAEFIKIPPQETKIKRKILSEYVSGFEIAPFSHLNDAVLILLYSGCRSKEILSNSTLFDFDKNCIIITEAKNKTSVRTIPIHPNVLEVAKRFAEEKRPAYKDLYAYTKSLGFTPHDCRHTFATRCHECNLNELVIQKLLGHTPDTLTQKVYTHIGIEEMRSELNKLFYPVC